MPDIVYIDDDVGFLEQLLREGLAKRYHPHDTGDGEEAAKAAEHAFLWVFDFFYGDQPKADVGESNGSSVFESWRGALREKRPFSVVVSHHVEQAFGPGRSHQLARKAAVDWVASKSGETAEQIRALAQCSRWIAEAHDRRRKVLTGSGNIVEDVALLDVLKAPDADWRASALRQVDRARPPSMPTALSGRGFARELMTWLTQQILPYPSFLIGLPYVAARLRLPMATLYAVAQEESPLGKSLRDSKYAGPLAEFDRQPRWWRAAIDEILLRASEDTTYENGLNSMATRQLDFLALNEPVVVANVDLEGTTDIVDASECVRAEDEFLPAHIDAVWVRIEEARQDALLRSKVVFEDRPLLDREV